MYIQDHGVPQKVIDKAFATAKGFFDQPLDAKLGIHYKKSAILRGYEPIAEVATDETRSQDLNEAFNCGYEPDLDPLSSGGDWSSIKSAMQGANAWPALSDFKESVASYYGEMLKLARRLVKIFAVVLGLPCSHFDEVFTHPGAMLRLLKYPAQDPMKPDALGVGAHTDMECFTILCQDTRPALQVLNVDGPWIEVPPIPGTFVVNIGDMLARWSNDTFISTVHRVLNITGEERSSIPFFFGPNYDTVLTPLETCVVGGSIAQYEPVVAGDYVYQRLARSRLGKQASEIEFQQTAAAA